MNRLSQRLTWWLLAVAMVCSMLAAAKCGGPAFSELPGTTHDGRFQTRCHAWGADTSKELCTPSFYRLLAKPEQYHGKVVGLTGFLIEQFGRFVLFPSQEVYAANQDAEGIEITGLIERDNSGRLIMHSPDIPDEIKNSATTSGVQPITVVGIFDAKYVGVEPPRSGAIQLHHMIWSPRVRGS
jgi:hypothetical protein